LSNTDPFLTLLSTLLSPIISTLYGRLSALDCMKTADPALADTARGLLITRGRVVDVDEGIAVMWGCVDGPDGD